MSTASADATAAPAEPYPPAYLGWWALVVFTVALIVAYADRQVLNLMVDPVRGDLHITDTQISLLQGAAFGILYATAGVPLGRIADIFPRRAVIIGGVIVWSLATFACGLASSFGWLFLGRVLVGTGEAALLPAALSILSDYFPPSRRGTAIGVIIVGAAAGNALATFIGGYLFSAVKAGTFDWLPGIHTVSPWRAVFFLVSSPGLLVILLLLTVGEPARRAVNAAAATVATTREVLAEFGARAGAFVPVYGALIMMGISSFAVLSWAPALLSRHFGFTPLQVGSYLGLFMLVGGVAGSLGSGLFGDFLTARWGKPARLAAAASVGLMAVAGACIAFVDKPILVAILVGVSTFGTAGSMAIASATIQDIASSRIRGVASALVSMAGAMMGMLFGPTLVALITDKVLHDPMKVGIAISSVGVPAAVLGVLLLLVARVNLKRNPGLSAS